MHTTQTGASTIALEQLYRVIAPALAEAPWLSAAHQQDGVPTAALREPLLEALEKNGLSAAEAKAIADGIESEAIARRSLVRSRVVLCAWCVRQMSVQTPGCSV
jgi:hypothetical protein